MSNVPENELLPCPFCGGPAGVMKAAGVHQACCADPGCPANGTYDTYEEAAKVWNTRPIDPSEDDIKDALTHSWAKNPEDAIIPMIESWNTRATAPAQEPVAWRWRFEDETSWTLVKTKPGQYSDTVVQPLFTQSGDYRTPAPVFKAAQNSAESDPSVKPDWAGAGTGEQGGGQ